MPHTIVCRTATWWTLKFKPYRLYRGDQGKHGKVLYLALTIILFLSLATSDWFVHHTIVFAIHNLGRQASGVVLRLLTALCVAPYKHVAHRSLHLLQADRGFEAMKRGDN